MAAQAHDWELASCDLTGKTRAYLQEWSFTLIRRINAYSEIDMQVVPGAQGSSEIQIGQRIIKAWRDNVIRATMRIADPLTRKSNNIDVKAFDAAYNLNGRRVQLDGNGNPPSYTNIDFSQIMWDRFYQQSLRSVIRVQQGTLAASSLGTITLNADDVEYQVLQNLAGLDGAPWWRVDPLDNTTGMWGSFSTYFPTPGSDRKGAKFEFGPTTKDNLADYQVVYTMPKNRVVARGNGTTDTAPTATQQDTGSQSTYDLWEDTVSGAANVTTQDQVNRLAIVSLLPTPPQTWTLTPNPAGETPSDVPVLFDDFDVGDTVYWTVNDYDLNEAHSGIVTEAQLKVNQSGVEQLTSLTIQQVT